MQKLTFIIFTLAFSCFSGACIAGSDLEDRRALAERLLLEINMDDVMHRMMPQDGLSNILVPPDQMPIDPIVRSIVIEHEKLAKERFFEIFNWKAMAPDIVELYANYFTKEELRKIIEMQKQPLSKKFVEFQIQSQPEVQRIAQELMQ